MKGIRRFSGIGPDMLLLGFGHACLLLGQWAAIVLLARLADAAALGRFGLALAITGPVFVIASLGLRHAQATEHQGTHSPADYLRVQSIAAAIGLGIAILAAQSFARMDGLLATVALLALSRCFELHSELLYGLFQRHSRVDLAARSLVLRGIGVPVVFAVILLHSGNSTWAVIAFAAVSAATLWLHDLPHARRLVAAGVWSHDPDPGTGRRLRALVRLGAPMGLAAFLVALQFSLPRFAVEYWMGLAALGQLTAILVFFTASVQLVNVMGFASTSRLAERAGRGDRPGYHAQARQIVLVAGLLGAIGLLAASLLGRPLLALVYGIDYGLLAEPLTVLALGAGLRFVSAMLQMQLIALRRFDALLAIQGSVFVVGLAASIVLVPRFGISGAAWALVVMSVANVLAAGWVCRRASERAFAPEPGVLP